jgi:hypothetical protein
MPIRVVTLNLWGRSGAWEERRSVLAAGLRKLDADLLAFQEAVVADGYDQVADLLGPDYTSPTRAAGPPTASACRSPAAGRWARCTRSTCTSPRGPEASPA